MDPSAVPLPASRDSLDSVRSDRDLFINGTTSSIATLTLESLQEENPSRLKHGNGDGAREPSSVEDERQRIRELEEELGRTRGEKEAFEAQYRSLLGKLTTMRNTLGDKLKQDADELDRREMEINELRERNDDLTVTVETLKSELIQSHADSEHVHSELEQLRLRAFDSQRQTSDEAAQRELALRDAQEDLERVRIERDEWEGEAMRERVRREELVARVGALEMELGTAKAERELMREERDREAESSTNLLAVLEEFQTAKDREIKSTLGDLQSQLQATTESLATYKQRATQAEAQVAAAQNDSEKLLALTKEVKDKSLLIGKLRHDAVILNEHLTEALRRLKKDSNENSVDRRLVSNVLITFLNTPRADTKRFEMLQLISSILSWTDDQREQVGLQRASGISGPSVIASGSRQGRSHARSGGSSASGLGENENFGQLWVEFLLKEASTAGGSAPKPPASTPGSSIPGSPPPNSPNGLTSRFDFSQLPPILSPTGLGASPHISSPPSTRRPSFTSYTSYHSSSSPSPHPPAPPSTSSSIAEER